MEGNVKAELDSHRNSKIEQTISNLEEGEQYQLILSYSPRVKNHKNTNKIKLWWNNKKLAVLNGKTKGWITKTFTVTASSQNKLKLHAIGKSDSLGGLIDHVQLYKLDCQQGNTPPVAENQSIETNEDTSVEIVVNATDADASDQLILSVLQEPSHGTLTGDAPNLIYTPHANYQGEDSFVFKANDGQVDSNTATVSITVLPINDTSVAENQSLQTNENANLPLTLVASDPDGDEITFSILIIKGV